MCDGAFGSAPESLGIEVLKPIRNDVLDRGFGLALIPGDWSQRHVTRRFGHAPTITQDLKCGPVINSAVTAP
jgi:hypothetical protein